MSAPPTTTASGSALSSSVTSPVPVLQLSYETPAAVAPSASPIEDSSPADATKNGTTTLTEDELAQFNSILTAQGPSTMREFFLNKYESESVRNWDKFYKRNCDRFYKDRHYLTKEFLELRETLNADRVARGDAPIDYDELLKNSNNGGNDEEDDGGAPSNQASSSSSGSKAAPPSPFASMKPITEPTVLAAPTQRRLLEVGCGVGNALFPLLRLHENVFFYGIDCSRNAIQVVQNHGDYFASGRCAAWVVDLVQDDFPAPIRDGEIDFATLIFVLSAIHPDKMETVLRKVHQCLKPDSGVLFIRDYALYDLAQLRFAKTSKLGTNWYVRNDGTRSYFYTLEQLTDLLTKVGFEILDQMNVKKTVINRKEKSEMSRRFVQVRARAMRQSPSSSSSNESTNVVTAPATQQTVP